jgi:hypothetical protein
LRRHDRHAIERKHTHQKQQRKQQIETGAGNHDGDPFEQALMGERFFDIFLTHLFIGILANHFDVSTERKCAQCVFSLTFFSHPELGTEAN